MKTQCRIAFRDARYPALVVPAGAVLPQHLTVENSPVLFGCRTGLCGTCVIRVEGDVPPATDDEREVLELVAPGDNRARLACQLDVVADVTLERIPETE